MKRISTDAEYLNSGKLVLDADGIPFEPVSRKSFNDSLMTKADKSYVDFSVEPKANKSYVDSAVEPKADKTYVDDTKWPRGAFSITTLPNMDDAPEGVVTVNTSQRSMFWGLPEGLLGFVVTYFATAFKVQIFYAITSAGLREYTRNQTSSGWTQWARTDNQLELAKTYTDSAVLEAKQYADDVASDEKLAYIPLSRPWGTGPGHSRSYEDFHWRVPLNLQTPTDEGIRVCFANAELITETVLTAPAVITGVYVGAGVRGPDGELTGEFKEAPTPLLTTPLEVPTDGTPVYTPVGAKGVELGRDTIISYGLTSDGVGTYLYTHSTGWQTANNVDAQRMTPIHHSGRGGSPTQQIGLVVGAEVKTAAPRVLVIGDSHMVGLAGGKPMIGTPASIAAGQGWVPRIHAIGGTRYSTWANNTLMWEEVSRSGADKVLLALGSNDLFGGGATVADTQAHFLTVVGKIRASVGDVPIHVMTVFPRNREAANSDMTAMMEEFNTWLYTLPAGVQAVIPTENIVDAATGIVDTRWISGDDVHLSLAGNVRLAQNFQIS